MQIDLEELRSHYAWLSDEALLAVDRTELAEPAQRVYDEEVQRRPTCSIESYQESNGAGDVSEFAIDVGPEPDWLEDAACAYSILIRPGAVVAQEASRVRSLLRAAGIPCHIVTRPVEEWEGNSPPPHEYCVMVPGELQLHAASILDQAIFNSIEEATWRTHFETLTDEQLEALDPEIFCAGILDRANRLRNAYCDETSKRDLASRAASA